MTQPKGSQLFYNKSRKEHLAPVTSEQLRTHPVAKDQYRSLGKKITVLITLSSHFHGLNLFSIQRDVHLE